MVPINETVNSLLDDMNHGSGSLYGALEASILKRFKLLIRRSDWSDNLPQHLQPRFLLFDDGGNELCTGRDLRALLAAPSNSEKQLHSPKVRETEQKIIDFWDDTTHTDWQFSGLPNAIPTYTPGAKLPVFSTRHSQQNQKKAGSELVLKKTRRLPKIAIEQGFCICIRGNSPINTKR